MFNFQSAMPQTGFTPSVGSDEAHLITHATQERREAESRQEAAHTGQSTHSQSLKGNETSGASSYYGLATPDLNASLFENEQLPFHGFSYVA